MFRSSRRAGAILGYANIIVKNIVNLLYTPMLLAFVGQGDYGVFQTANSFVFSLTLLSFGFAGAYVRFYTQRQALGDDDGIRTLNGMYLVLYLAICALAIVVGLFFSVNVGVIFSESFTTEEVVLARILMAIMTINIAVTLLSSVFDANVMVHEKFVFQQTRQMLTSLATPGLALALLHAGFGTVGVACAQLAVNIALLLMNITFAVRQLGMRFDFRYFDWPLFRSIAAFSGWLFANQVCDLVNQNVPNVVLGAQCGAVVVAVFSVSVQLRNVFIALSTTLSNVFIPQVNRVVAESNDNEALVRIMTRVGRLQMALLGWVYGGFTILGKFFIARWAGEGFADAYWMLLVMVAPLLVPLSQNVGIEIQKAKNMHKARSVVYLGMAALNVAFTSVVAPQIGYWAPAIAYVTSIALGNCLFMNWYYQTRVGLDMAFYWKAVLPVVLCAALSTSFCLLGTQWLPVTGWTKFLGWGIAFTVLYALTLFSISLTAEERSALLVKAGAK